MADRKKPGSKRAPNATCVREHERNHGPKVPTNVRTVEASPQSSYSKDIEVVFGLQDIKDNHPRTPKDLCSFLVSEKSVLENVLNHSEVFKDKFHSIWFLIASCCQCEEEKELTNILKTVHDAEEFINNGLLKFLVQVISACCQEDVDTLCHITIYLEALFKHYPTLSLFSLTLILPFLQDALRANRHIVGEGLLSRVERLEKGKLKINGKPDVHLNWSNIDDLKDNFRNMSILPDTNEINIPDKDTLPSQDMEGRHHDVEEYLNYHFRLIRSEMIRLIHQKVSLCKDYIKKGNDEHFCEISSYKDVRITNILVSEDGILHEIQFPFSDSFNSIPWKYSKHFTAGCLLCFTSDNFKTVFFATIVGHDPILLEQNKFYVHFEPETLMSVNSNSKTVYVVTEIDVHCDVCFRILSNLQKMSGNFPFEKALVNLQNQTEPPFYARDKSLRYCFDTVLSTSSAADCVIKKEIHSYEDSGCVGEKIEIHNMLNLPSFDFGLDESQKCALKTALTQSLTIIQGSPGTGKTHVALKLTKILLHNRHSWANTDASCPIVVLTCSSTCLDTFLEGMLETTRKIIRIGGKSKSSLLDNYNLKRKTALVDTLSRAKAKREVAAKLKEISQTISDIESRKRNIKCELLSVEELSKNIALNDLERLQVNCAPDVPLSADMDTLLKFWLDFDNLRQNEHGEVQESTFREGSRKTERKAKNFECETEYLKDVQDAVSIHDERSIEGEFQDLTAVFPDDTHPNRSVYGKRVNSHQPVIEIIRQRLNVVTMTAAQSAFCTDLWNLSLENRWGLYLFWVSKCDEKYDEEIRACRLMFEEQLSKLKAITEIRKNEALCEAEVIGLTMTGAANYSKAIKRLNPKIIIIEEAEKIPESFVLLLLNEETEHLILFGDQKSSGTIGTLFRQEDTSEILPSLFQRLYLGGFPHCPLRVQYNLRSSISQLLLSSNFGELAVHASVPEEQTIKGLEKNVFFFTHLGVETRLNDGICYVNDYEANFMVELCRYILLQGYSSTSIVILTPYLAQFYKLSKRMVGNLHGVKVSLSGNFQEYSDIILVSCVRSETELASTSLAEDNLLYTALTRTKIGLYFVGNFEALAKKSNIWKNLCESLKERNCFGPTLNVLCQAHGHVVSVKSLRDWFRLGDGGCGGSCKHRMPCGHECPRKCHPSDREHKNTKCMEPCQASACINNHKCHKLCGEKCGNCLEVLDNVILRCGHSAQVSCFRLTLDQRSYWEIPYKVEQSLSGKDDIKLAFAVKFSTGNNGDICFPTLEQECDVLCGKQLECGHQCKGKCGECLGGRIHVPCLEVCGKMQMCGHRCLYPCASPCPPCSFQYENKCNHTSWTVFCGFPTALCLKPCEWSCEHLKCSRLCHEVCDRPPCNEPCKVILSCGHNCIGLCGEPCPDKCRICDREITSLYFGNEHDPRARFVQLVDCGHIFEVNGLIYWITKEHSRNLAIGLIKCPTCNKPILKNHLFDNLIKYQTRITEDLKSEKYSKMCNISEVKGMLSVVKEDLKMLSKRNTTHERFWAVEQSCTDPCSILETLYARLLIKYSPIDQGMFALFYNYYTFVLENYKIVSKTEKLQELVSFSPLGGAARRTRDFIGCTLEAVNERILYFWDFGSVQFIEEIAWELRRLHIACDFVMTYQSFFGYDDAYIQGKLSEALSFVLLDHPFRKHEEWMFNLLLEEIQTLCPGIPILSTLSEPAIPLMEAMDLREGKCLWNRLEGGGNSVDIKGSR